MSKAENERPTSGKHFSRISINEGDTSELTLNFKRSKKIDALMNKLK